MKETFDIATILIIMSLAFFTAVWFAIDHKNDDCYGVRCACQQLERSVK